MSAPPSISVAEEKFPPSNVSASFPAPRLIFPAMAAALPTVTLVFPAAPKIAPRVPTPTDAPLPSEILTSALAETSVLIAATPDPAPPATDPETAMDVSPSPA